MYTAFLTNSYGIFYTFAYQQSSIFCLTYESIMNLVSKFPFFPFVKILKMIKCTYRRQMNEYLVK